MKKLTPPSRTYRLALNGELKGFELTMRGLSAGELIVINTPGGLSNADAIKMTVDHIVESNFDVTDHADLDWWIVTEIMGAWLESMKDAAVPPEPGER